MSESLHLVPEPSSARTLEQLEAIIAANVIGLRMGMEALAEIHDRKLYKATHSSFELYCLERWSLSRSTAWRQIGQAKEQAALPPGTPKPPQESVEKRAQRTKTQNVAHAMPTPPLTRDDTDGVRDKMTPAEPDPGQETWQFYFNEAVRLTDVSKALKTRLDRVLDLLDCPHRTRDRNLRCLRCWDQK